MGKGRIRVEERIKAETDEEMYEAQLLADDHKDERE
ncbi:YhdX family protein [Metabacillus herbersteinensis]|uniref:YhdX family protein n=1 Tax=Metabacillus herbersteinensis TaxID=283816 RepID=A0ABV6GEM5_9BACI